MLRSSITHTETDGQTDTKVNTEDTLLGFQEFFLQRIIKDRSNKSTGIQKTFADMNYLKKNIKQKCGAYQGESALTPSLPGEITLI